MPNCIPDLAGQSRSKLKHVQLSPAPSMILYWRSHDVVFHVNSSSERPAMVVRNSDRAMPERLCRG